MSLVLHYWIGDVQDSVGVSASKMTYIVSSGALKSTRSLFFIVFCVQNHWRVSQMHLQHNGSPLREVSAGPLRRRSVAVQMSWYFVFAQFRLKYHKRVFSLQSIRAGSRTETQRILKEFLELHRLLSCPFRRTHLSRKSRWSKTDSSAAQISKIILIYLLTCRPRGTVTSLNWP